ncbi:hypothetical protein BKI52_10455 [marine bacterium AO1-C]|nr:hypothetical protein BKI52_10455 [marine bacterium AO1-C]
MEPNAVLLYNGLPVKLQSSINGYDFTHSYRLSDEGMLTSFETNGREYFFLSRLDVFKEDLHFQLYVPGYYDRESYAKYRTTRKKHDKGNAIIELTKEATLTGFAWNSGTRNPNQGFETASDGDIVVVRRLSPEPPFNKYYQNKTYYFKIPEQYSESIAPKLYTSIDNFPPVNENEHSPSYSEVKSEYIEIGPSSATYHFYKRNFGDHIGSPAWSNIDDTVETDNELDLTRSQLSRPIVSKKGYATFVTLICWRIHHIIKKILPKIAINSLDAIEVLYGDYLADIQRDITPPTDKGFKALPLSDQTIGMLLHSWGRLDSITHERSFDDFKSTLPTTPGYSYLSELRLFKQSLDNFYHNLHFRKKEDMFPDDATLSPEEQSDQRLLYLIKVLPISAMRLISKETRFKILLIIAKVNKYPINILKDGIKASTAANTILGALLGAALIIEDTKDTIPYANELLVIKLLESVADKEEANYFLNNLMNLQVETSLGSIPLFQKLYRDMSDKNDGFFIAADHRKKFILRLYLMWYVSDYNYNDILEGENYTGSADIAESFKNTPISLNYNSEKSWGFYLDNMKFFFEGNKILVKEEQVEEKFYGKSTTHEKKDFVPIGTYDYYQAVSLRSYKTNDTAIKIPVIAINNTESAIIPLFFLKYMDDFGDQDDMWTGVGLTLDIALTFTGIGNLAKLRHLRHLSKLRLIFSNPNVAKEGLALAIQAIPGIIAAVDVTLSVADIIIKYYLDGCQVFQNDVKANINNDNEEGKVPEDKPGDSDYQFCKNLDRFLFWLQLGTGFSDLLVESMLRRSAQKVVKTAPDEFKLDVELPDGTKVNPFSVIESIAGKLDVMGAKFQNKLTKTLGDSDANKFWDEFKVLSDDDQYEFLLDFGDASESQLKKLYKTENQTSLIEEWQILKHKPELRVDIDHLETLQQVKSKFTFNNKTGKEALQDVLDAHEAPEAFLVNLKKADKQYGDLDGIKFSGDKSNESCLLTTKSAQGDDIILGKFTGGKLQDSLIDAWKVLKQHPSILTEANLRVLTKTEGKFVFNGKKGFEGIDDILNGHPDPQGLINNLNRADELYGDLNKLTFTGSKTNADCKLLELSNPPYPEIELGTIANGVLQNGSLMEAWKICLGILHINGSITNHGWRTSQEFLRKISNILEDPVVLNAIKRNGLDANAEFSKMLSGLQASPCKICSNAKKGNSTFAPVEEILDDFVYAVREIEDYKLGNVITQLKRPGRRIPIKRGWIYEMQQVVKLHKTRITSIDNVSFSLFTPSRVHVNLSKSNFDAKINAVFYEFKSVENIIDLYTDPVKVNQLLKYFSAVRKPLHFKITFDSRALIKGYGINPADFDTAEALAERLTSIAKSEMKTVLNDLKGDLYNIITSNRSLQKSLKVYRFYQFNDTIINKIINEIVHVD